MESCDDLCEWEVADDIEDIAESMEEVRGTGRGPGRIDPLFRAGGAMGRDCGGDSPLAVVDGNGDDTFRN